MNVPRYAVGDLVMFVCRAQRTVNGMRVSKVDPAPLFGDHKYYLEGDLPQVWWNEGNLMSLYDWQQQINSRTV